MGHPIPGGVGDGMIHLHTQRLHIHPYAVEDCDALIDILTDDIVKQTFLVPDYPERAQYEKLFVKMRQLSASAEHYAGGIYFENNLIGLVLDVEMADGSIEMGYALHPAYHNRGFCTEAMQAVIAHLFEAGFREVIAGAFSDNAASIRVMEKCGMKKIDRTDPIDYRGKIHTCIYYAIRSE